MNGETPATDVLALSDTSSDAEIGKALRQYLPLIMRTIAAEKRRWADMRQLHRD